MEHDPEVVEDDGDLFDEEFVVGSTGSGSPAARTYCETVGSAVVAGAAAAAVTPLCEAMASGWRATMEEIAALGNAGFLRDVAG